MRAAVLDLGSNSFRLLVADVDDDGTIRPILRDREMLHLGGTVADDGAIAGADLDRAASAAQHLAALGRRTGADQLIVVATAAVREASNHEEVVDVLSASAGEPVRVLSGQEEAEMAFVGAATSVALPDGPHLVLDLGGGSLELAIGKGTEVAWTASVDLGVSRLWAETGRADPLTDADIDRLRDRVRESLAPLLEPVRSHGITAVALVGGPNRSVAQVVAPERLRWQPETLNQFVISASEVSALADVLVQSSIGRRLAMPGMKRSRAATLPTAAVIIAAILECLGVGHAYMSYWGLREGVILRTFGVEEIPHGADLRPAAIERMERRFSPHRAHDAHVANLAGALFADLEDVHRLSSDDAEMLGYAARLHTIGMGVAFHAYHRHGAYLIEHSEFRGFDPVEIAMLAAIVRHHRRGFPRAAYPPYEALGARNRLRVARMVALLHVADALDRSLDQSVEGVAATADAAAISLDLEGSNVAIRPDWAKRAREAVRATFDLDLVFPPGSIVDL